MTHVMWHVTRVVACDACDVACDVACDIFIS